MEKGGNKETKRLSTGVRCPGFSRVSAHGCVIIGRLRRLLGKGVGGLKAEMRMSCLMGESRGTPQPQESVFRLKELCGGQSLYG